MRLLSREQARFLDDLAMNQLNIPGVQLMDSAGKAISDLITERNGELNPAKVAIFSGKGNNGGDGFAAALWLKKAGMEPEIFFLSNSNDPRGDAKHYFEKCRIENISIMTGWDLPESGKYSFAVDAYLGTGFSGDLPESAIKIFDWLQNEDLVIISADIPSGVDANTGTCSKGAVFADYTVTMGESKIGLVCGAGAIHAGEVVVADIGFPKNVDYLGINWFDFELSSLYNTLEPPLVDTNKVKQGKVLVVGGSKGMTGAAILAGKAALRAGAGLVINAVPESLNMIFESNSIEVMTSPINDNGKGFLDESCFDELSDVLEWCDALIIGPGLGRSIGTGNLVERILSNFNKPAVIDADGLFFYQINKKNHVLTPHPGEFSRIHEGDGDRIARINDFMSEFEGVLVQKDVTTVTVSGNKGIVNTSGHQGLATAGSGDVLAGMIGSFLAQGFEPFEAASIAVYLHGYAADLLLDEFGFRGLNATDLVETIPNAIAEFELQGL